MKKVLSVHQSHSGFESLIQVCKPSSLCGSDMGWVLFKIMIEQDFYMIRTADCPRGKKFMSSISPILMIVLPVSWNNWNTDNYDYNN